MDLPNSVRDHGLSGFWNRILVASVTARAGLSDAFAISYIQYIGVVIAGLTSVGSSGGRPNSPIGILSLNHVSDPKICGYCVTKRQYPEGLMQRVNALERAANPLIRRLESANHGGARCSEAPGRPQMSRQTAM